jgi:glycosyltransferase involved in cell wall biosynthesis
MLEKSVSVVMCTYNGEKYLREQLDSIIDQTYPIFEIIVQDDCSTDGTLFVLSEYEPRIKILKNKENKGYNENFKSVLYKARGDLIVIADQDDIWTKDKIEKLVTNIGDNFLIFSKSIRFDNHNTQYTIHNTQQTIPNVAIEEIAFRNKISGHTMLIRKELLYAVKYWDTRYFYDWWLAIAAAYLDKVAFLDKPLVFWRRHDDSVTQQMIKHKESIWQKMRRLPDFLNRRRNYLLSLNRLLDSFEDDKHETFKEIIRLAGASNVFKIFWACCKILKLKDIYYPDRKVSLSDYFRLFIKPISCWA